MQSKSTRPACIGNAACTKISGIVFPVLGRTAGGVDGAGCARGAVGHIICVRVINRVLSHPSNPCTRMAEYQYDTYYVFILYCHLWLPLYKGFGAFEINRPLDRMDKNRLSQNFEKYQKRLFN